MADLPARIARQEARIDLAPWQLLAQQAVEAARSAGARYADARLTRVVRHEYGISGSIKAEKIPTFRADEEYVGIGIRALVDGAWGFSASTIMTSNEADRLAKDAVGQAKDNTLGPPRTVDLGHYPIPTGSWQTPGIDPFQISIEEKQAFILYWKHCADIAEVNLYRSGFTSWLSFVRQERVVATSEGGLFSQTLYESGGEIVCDIPNGRGESLAVQNVHGIGLSGAGWDLFLDAKIPEQFLSGQLKQELAQKAGVSSRPGATGRYTLVCDGMTMAALTEATLGVATQLDRALGYEANANGTSFIDDPLGMVGTARITSPHITMTANRSAPKELATVKWDDEGVEPKPFTLIKDGVLVDFQTTREQAAWLAPYYQKTGQPVRSHGCSATESAHVIPLQHMPNLSLEPSALTIRLEDLVADVNDGVLVEAGTVDEIDSQARTGLLSGSMRQIKNGRLGEKLTGLTVLFTAPEFWNSVKSIGGSVTQDVIYTTQFYNGKGFFEELLRNQLKGKGQPPQLTSHSVRAAAAMIVNQPLIDQARKA